MNLVSLKNWSTEDVMTVVEMVVEGSITIKNNPERYADTTSRRTLAMLFQKTSTRTRCAGEVGMTQLGGHAVFLDWRTTNFRACGLRR